jgi:alpha-ketoglutarate-dependent taurine dioxygenase
MRERPVSGAEATGPISGGRHGWAFAASGRDLAAEGYIEEEYFLAGEATEFALAEDSAYGVDGRWDVVPRQASSFTTRFLVRRPRDPARFSGTVVVHWNNVSLGFEYPGRMNDEIVASGSAWVGATVQTVGLDGLPGAEQRALHGWDAARYGSLSILDDDASFDIFTQIASAVGPDRLGHAEAVDPMGGLPVTRLLALGESQSACRLATYYNAIQPLARRFDGFLLVVYAGGGTRVEADGPGPSLDAIPAELRSFINVMPFGCHRLRTDLAVPVMVLNSETEGPWYRPVRQPDSGTYRLWEVAGAAHLSGGFSAETEAEWQRDFGEVVSVGIVEPVSGPPNTLSFEPVKNAALHHLWSWMRDGTPPPTQARLDFAGEPPALVRDELGNALGGIRLPDLAVPVATHTGASEGVVPDLVGSSVPLPAPTLRALYPDRATYVGRYDRAVAEGLARGYLLDADARRLREGAAAAAIVLCPERRDDDPAATATSTPRGNDTREGMKVTPQAGALGASITGIDLAQPLDEATWAELEKLFLDYLVLAFRGQDITPEQHLAFASRWGTVVPHPYVPSIDGYPGIMRVYDPTPLTQLWHSDFSYARRPPKLSILVARTLPPVGGDTMFANQYAAYDALSDGMKRLLDGLRAVHEGTALAVASGLSQEDVTWTHPVVRTHPQTGRKCLFVNADYTKRFEGMTDEESAPLLAFLYQQGGRAEYTYRHRWADGDVLMWDNRAVLHAVIGDVGGAERSLHRVAVAGDEPR